MSEYFPKPTSLGVNVEVQLDLSNYATKSDLEYETGVDTSDIVKKNRFSWLGNLMQRNSVELIKLGDVVKNDVFKNDVCNA